jgi:hypothetical protein
MVECLVAVCFWYNRCFSSRTLTKNHFSAVHIWDSESTSPQLPHSICSSKSIHFPLASVLKLIISPGKWGFLQCLWVLNCKIIIKKWTKPQMSVIWLNVMIVRWGEYEHWRDKLKVMIPFLHFYHSMFMYLRKNQFQMSM